MKDPEIWFWVGSSASTAYDSLDRADKSTEKIWPGSMIFTTYML